MNSIINVAYQSKVHNVISGWVRSSKLIMKRWSSTPRAERCIIKNIKGFLMETRCRNSQTNTSGVIILDLLVIACSCQCNYLE